MLSKDRTAIDEQYLEEMKRRGFDHIKLTAELITPKECNDTVNHPPHYNNSAAKCECGRRIECIDVTRHLPFNIGNAIKYLWRCDLKGSALEDLKKAAWYIQDEIKLREKEKTT